jgi:hypothetical protein
MHRFLAALIAGLLLTAVGSAPGTQASPTGEPPSYAVGGGKTDNGPILGVFSFNLSAHTGPNGDSGFVSVKEDTFFGTLDYRVDVDCVNITAFKTATISGEGTRVSPVPNYRGINVGHRFFFFVEDEGNPSGSVPVDAFIPKDDPAPPADCKTIILGGAQRNVIKGNVVIKGPAD